MITDEHLRRLRAYSASAGNHAVVLLCDLALGEVELDADRAMDSVAVASFVSQRDRRRIASMNPDDYRNACEDEFARLWPSED